MQIQVKKHRWALSVYSLMLIAIQISSAQAAPTHPQLAGNALTTYPFFEYVKAFNANASVSVAIGDQSEGLSGRASPKDLETLMQLTYLRMTAPRADSSRFQALLQQFEAALKNKDANPQAVFSDTIQMTLANG